MYTFPKSNVSRMCSFVYSLISPWQTVKKQHKNVSKKQRKKDRRSVKTKENSSKEARIGLRIQSHSKEKADQKADQSINQSIDRSTIYLSMNQSINQSINRSIDLSNGSTTNHAVNGIIKFDVTHSELLLWPKKENVYCEEEACFIYHFRVNRLHRVGRS